MLKRETTGEISLVLSQDPADLSPAFISYHLLEIGSMAMDAAGNLYVESQYETIYPDHFLFKVSPGGVVSYGPFFSSYLYSPDVPRSIVYNPITDGIIFTRTSDDAIMHRPTTEITVLAGTAWALNGVDGIGSAARFTGINGITVDQSGNVLIGDANTRGNRFHGNFGSADLRQISPGGTVKTLYASPRYDSPAAYPIGVASDHTGNIYFATAYPFHPFIRLAADGTVTPYERENSYYAIDMTIDALGNLLVLDNEHRIHQRNPVGAWSVLAGKNGEPAIHDGSGESATFGDLLSITVSRTGEIFVLDSMRSSTPTGNEVTTCVIRQVRSNGSVTTVSSNLVKSAAASGSVTPDYPSRLAIDSKGVFFLVYYGSHIVTRLNATGEETEIGGKAGVMGSVDGDGANARFQNPNGIAVDAQDNLYVVDGRGTTVRQGQLAGYLPLISVQPQNQSAPAGSNITLSVIASGTPAPTYQWFFNGSAFNGATSNTLSFANAHSADAGDYTVVVTNSLGSVTSNKATLTVSAASTPTPTPTPTPVPSGGSGGGSINTWFALALLGLGLARSAMSASSSETATAPVSGLTKFPISRNRNGGVHRALCHIGAITSRIHPFPLPSALFCAALFICLNLAALAASNYATPYSFTTLAGVSSIGSHDGTGTAAQFYGPAGLATDAAGNVFVTDEGNDTIRKVTPAGTVTTFAGAPGILGSTDGTGTLARFDNPPGSGH